MHTCSSEFSSTGVSSKFFLNVSSWLQIASNFVFLSEERMSRRQFNFNKSIIREIFLESSALLW